MTEAELLPILEHITAFQREMHRKPELSGFEAETSRRVREEMQVLGFCVQEVTGCKSLVAMLQNGEGPCIAVRADMDALPVQENTGLSWASEIPGVMHACGHDAHTAIALGSAIWLAANRDKWHGNACFLFESAEETTGDARLIASQGFLQGVDAVIGQHVNPAYPAGTFIARPGCVNGSSDDVTLHIHGKAGHGAYPESGVDSVVIAAQVVSSLQTLVSRSISPFEAAALTFGRVEGGHAGNVLCPQVTLTGTLRTLAEPVRLKLHERIRTIAASIAEAMGGSAQTEINPSYPALHNDPVLYTLAEETARSLLGVNRVIRRAHPSLGVESFAFLLDECPGVFYDIGCGVGSGLHTDTFCIREDTLRYGLSLQLALIQRLMTDLRK